MLRINLKIQRARMIMNINKMASQKVQHSIDIHVNNTDLICEK